MADYLLPIGYTLFVWWFSTGVILYLDGLPRRTFAVTLGAATSVLLSALWGLVHTRSDLSASGAYCAFTCAILVWAWQEIAFLLGWITGPRRTACPPGSRGWRRARMALEAVLHHELALLLLALAVLACVGGGSNRIGLWTYLALWGMRQSAKLNVFLGVRNLNESFLPDHLKYLHSYFMRKPLNALFPFSVTATTGAAVLLWQGVPAFEPGSHGFVAAALLATLVALGALEHWLLVLPLPVDAPWRWGLRSRQAPAVLPPA